MYQTELVSTLYTVNLEAELAGRFTDWKQVSLHKNSKWGASLSAYVHPGGVLLVYLCHDGCWIRRCSTTLQPLVVLKQRRPAQQQHLLANQPNDAQRIVVARMQYHWLFFEKSQTPLMELLWWKLKAPGILCLGNLTAFEFPRKMSFNKRASWLSGIFELFPQFTYQLVTDISKWSKRTLNTMKV